MNANMRMVSYRVDFLFYVIFTSVPGDVLGAYSLGFHFGGRGKPRAVLNLSHEDQKRWEKKLSIEDGMFKMLSVEERAVIRQQFESAYT